MTPVISLALPTWNSSPILWLALEGLCNQKTQYPWELIVCEDPSLNFCGKKYFTPYIDRLRSAGCVNFQYIELDKWVPLSYKWKILADYISTENYLLVASDNYSPFDRIEVTYNALQQYDWVDWSEGVFVNLNNFEQAKWVRPNQNKTGLYMGTKTSLIKDLQPPYPLVGIDGWIRDQRNITNRHHISSFPLGIHTDGANNISHHRKNHYTDPKSSFIPFLDNLEEVIPLRILDKLKQQFNPQ